MSQLRLPLALTTVTSYSRVRQMAVQRISKVPPVTYSSNTFEEKIDLCVADLSTKGWVVLESFLHDDLADQLANHIDVLKREARLRPAKIGKRENSALQSKIRGDRILWIDSLNPTPIEARYLSLVLEFGKELSRQLRMSFNAFECHYAHYPIGSSYKKHVDVFKDDDARLLSSVLYLNPNWKSGDGGELRIYSEKNPNQFEIDIEPRFNRLVLFLSRSIFHEVLETAAPRQAITGWYKRVYIQNDPLGLVL